MRIKQIQFDVLDLTVNRMFMYLGARYNRPEKTRIDIHNNKCCKPIFINGDWRGEIENEPRIKKPFLSYL